MAKTAGFRSARNSGVASASVTVPNEVEAGKVANLMVDAVTLSGVGGVATGTYLMQFRNGTTSVIAVECYVTFPISAAVAPFHLVWSEGRGPTFPVTGGDTVVFNFIKSSGTDTVNITLGGTWHWEP